MINKLIESGWAVTETNYALSIAEQTFPEECEQLVEALLGMTLDTQEHFIKRGGGESDQTQDLSAKLNSYGWVKNNISIDEGHKTHHILSGGKSAHNLKKNSERKLTKKHQKSFF